MKSGAFCRLWRRKSTRSVPSRQGQKAFCHTFCARTCKKLPVASFCASETAETGRIANGREQGDHVSRRQESYKGGKAAGNVPRSGEKCCGRQKKAAAGGEKSRGAAKGFKFVCAKFWFCALNRGLQNLEALFGKVLILIQRSRHCGELNRGLQNLDVLCKENGLSLFASCKK